MRRQLEKIKANHWPAFAKEVGYCVKTAAQRVGISTRWFEIKFHQRFGQTPRQRFARWRQQEIRARAGNGDVGKDIASAVSFTRCSTLSHALARAGLSLKKLRNPAVNSTSHQSNSSRSTNHGKRKKHSVSLKAES